MPSLVRNVLAASIVLLVLGGLGGSLQPTRLLLLFALPAVLVAATQSRRWTQVELLTLATYAMLIGFGVLSLLWSPTRADGISRIIVVLIGMCSIVYVRASPKTVETARRVRDAWSLALALTLPVAMYELATGNHFAYALDERTLGGSGDLGALPFASVFFGNYNDYCTFIALSLPMLFGTIESTKMRLLRWAWAMCALLALVVIAVNTNRVSMVFVTWLVLYFMLTRKAWRRVALMLALLATTAAMVTTEFNEAIELILVITKLRFESFGIGDEAYDDRLRIVLAGVQSLVSTYGLGIGVGAFEHYLVSNHSILTPNPHNLVIEVAANFGLIPVLAFGAWLLYLFVVVHRGQLPRDLKDPLMATLPFVPVIGAIGSQAVGYTYWWLWFSTAVLLAAVGQVLHRRSAPSAPSHYSAVSFEPRRF